MSNLIITIISIALAAIVGIMAIFYMGQAASNSSAKVMAVRLNNGLVQMRTAVNAYMSDTGHDFVSDLPSATSNPLQSEMETALEPKYLNSFPAFPAEMQQAGENCAGVYLASANGQFNASAGGGVIVVYYYNGSACHTTKLAVDTCKQLVAQNHGPGADPPGSANSGWVAAVQPKFVLGQMDCYSSYTLANMDNCIIPSGGSNDPCNIMFVGMLYQ